MNIYASLNEITAYIDEHINEDIDYNTFASIMGVNIFTMQKLFTLLCGVSLAEYIRYRRLSLAGEELIKDNIKIIDLAIKYNYDNATSFSRAFYAFHGIKPSSVDEYTKLKNYPRIIFDENITVNTSIEYDIVSLDELTLYGVYTDTSNATIENDAPNFFSKTEKKYIESLGPVRYGMVSYSDQYREECDKYYCLYEKKIEGFEEIKIEKSRWLRFRINSQEAKDIREISQKFYISFLPSTRYNLKEIPELEYYHDDITDFLVPIYD